MKLTFLVNQLNFFIDHSKVTFILRRFGNMIVAANQLQPNESKKQTIGQPIIKSLMFIQKGCFYVGTA